MKIEDRGAWSVERRAWGGKKSVPKRAQERGVYAASRSIAPTPWELAVGTWWGEW